MPKKKVTFVGAFNTNTQNTGGQLFACRSLLSSELSKNVKWDLIDTTASTNQQRSFINRLAGATKRLLKFSWSLLYFRPHTVLIFFADRASFIEKGLMAFLSKLVGRRIVLCPRSGLLITDISTSSFWKKFAHIVFCKADVVVCQSDSWKNFFESNVGEWRQTTYAVIPNWIISDNYQEIFQQRQTKEQTSAPNILFMGWVTKDKGIFDLIDAFHQLPSASAQLWIAGEGQDMTKAKEKVKELQLDHAVKFYGWVFDQTKLDLLKDADIFVLPSYYEGMPNAVLEAMACGLPVVATDVGGIPDLITDQVSGLLIKPGDTKSLSEKILYLINDAHKRKMFSLSAHQRIHENHTLEAAVAAFQKIL